ncbi:hypothetical protein HUW51_05055 [Adhaeribacter swui]|uniref:T9SS C-terminal target domain-containing protein n=1 Tax=Adhaeribacter swui TaxID=2086471 RepID=A0A7G7G4P4_9BACT|nr:hypothetical protein [Adhaeribacter swui]QNF32128.1 hypothetical protein HUW51_05055 [Adhaeribacter swui]
MKKKPTHLPWRLGLEVRKSGALHLCALLIIILNFMPLAHAQNVIWDKTLGGNRSDKLNSFQLTRDGGYILAGTSNSDQSGDKSQGTKGGKDVHDVPLDDYWVIKLNKDGSKAWDKTFGGTGSEISTAVQQTTDGGYILGGWSNSGKSGDKSEDPRGIKESDLYPYDYWVIKLSEDGSKAWDKTFGGTDSEYLTSIQQTSDGGYILGGSSASGISGDKSQANRSNTRGSTDYWVIKLNADGSKAWDKTIGGSDNDNLASVQQTSDGGYILSGSSSSSKSGEKSENNREDYNGFSHTNDYWVVKLNANGNKVWDKTFGGDANDRLNSIQQTQDGGYILGGFSQSGKSGDKTDTKRDNSYTYSDYWVVKIDKNGTKKWDTTVGGNFGDDLQALLQTPTGEFILAGNSASNISGEKSENNHGDEYTKDYWIVKLSSTGKYIYDKSFGGNGDETLTSLQQTSEGVLVLGGFLNQIKTGINRKLIKVVDLPVTFG